MLRAMTVFVFAMALGLLPALTSGTEYTVGDADGLTSDVDYHAWLDGKTFCVGDVLVFNYSKEDHNVVVVNSTGYDECISSPNKGIYDSGNDRITLRYPGNKY